MISAPARAILDRAGITVVQAVYAKTLTVRALPTHYADLVEFSGGTVQLGEVDEWLQEYARNQSDQARRSGNRATFSLWLALASLAVALASIVFGVLGYRIAKDTENNITKTQEIHQQLGRFIREGQAIIDDLEHQTPYGGVRQRANDWNRALTIYILDHLGDAYENRLHNEAGAEGNPPFSLTTQSQKECWYYLHVRMVRLEQFSVEQFASPPKTPTSHEMITDICPA
jgi:hypothetical protein